MTNESEVAAIKQRYQEVLQRCENAAKRAGQPPNSVHVVAVGKTFSVQKIQAAYDAGIRLFGENRVQELIDKANALPEDIRWHMVGHVQRNKAKHIIGLTEMIHSLDSMELAKLLGKRALREDVIEQVLVQVNISEEESKYGLSIADTHAFLEKVSSIQGIKVKGLMTIGPHTRYKDKIRQAFSKMHELYVDIRKQKMNNVDMDYLSMGMSYDYEIAILEGSNMVRVGSAIFGQRD